MALAVSPASMRIRALAPVPRARVVRGRVRSAPDDFVISSRPAVSGGNNLPRRRRPRRDVVRARASSGAAASPSPTPPDADGFPARPRSVLADLAAGRERPDDDRDGPTGSGASSASSGSFVTGARPPAFAALPRAARLALGSSALLLASALFTPPGLAPFSPSPAAAGPSASAVVGKVEDAAREKMEAALRRVREAGHLREYTPGEIFAYKIQKVFALPLMGKILCLFALTVPMVFVGGSVHKLVMNSPEEDGDDDEEEDRSWAASVRNAYFNLFDIPGAEATQDGDWKTFTVTQAIVFTGFFVFAVIIGIISDEIANKVEEVKTGNYRVIESDHTVVVNWNSQLVPMLKQMAVAKAERAGTFDKPVVLLADVDKEEMDAVVEAALEDAPGALEVVTRRGNPFDAEDLARVNAYRARRVVILHPHETDVGLLGEGGGEGGEKKSHGAAAALDAESERFQKQQREEALKATVVLNLLADGSRETTPDVIVQMPYRLDEKSDLVGHALRLSQRPGLVDPNLKGHTFRSGEASPAPSSSPYVQVHGSENSGKIGAISAFQPGASRIFEELFKQSDDSPEFYLSLAPSLVGKTFGEAWRSLPRATLCGLSHADGTVTLAPRDDVVIAHDDEVVMLSETSTVQIARPGEASASTPPRGSQRHYMRCIAGEKPQAVSILFAGWNTETATALQLAQSVAPAGSEITVLSDSVPKETLAKLKSTKKCKLRVLQGLPTSYDDLLRAKVQEMDAVVIMPDHAQGKAEEDASVLATMLQTHAICVDAAPGLGNPHIVATLNTDSARSIVELMGKIGAGDTVPDVIMSDDLVGGALLQVAANPKLAGLFDALLATDGHEIYLRDADLFGGMDTRVEGEGPVTWGTLCERARERNELAIGVLRADGELAISPAKAEAFAFEEGDKIIVLAEDL